MCTSAPTQQRLTQFMNAAEWTFPTSTCETPVDHLPRQPWSSLVNAAIICMLVCCRRHTNLVKSIVLFELIHLYSHVAYKPGLSVVQHYSMYAVLHYYAKPGRWTITAKVVDSIVVAVFGGIWQIYSGIALLFTYTVKDDRVKAGACAVALLLANEQLNCIRMLQFADLPYHCVLELVGMYVFYCMTEERKKWK